MEPLLDLMKKKEGTDYIIINGKLRMILISAGFILGVIL